MSDSKLYSDIAIFPSSIPGTYYLNIFCFCLILSKLILMPICFLVLFFPPLFLLFLFQHFWLPFLIWHIHSFSSYLLCAYYASDICQVLS